MTRPERPTCPSGCSLLRLNILIKEVPMANRGVVYKGPGRVAVEAIPDPKFETPAGRKITHGVILKVFSTNICGSDQHMVRGRTSAPAGMVLGHRGSRTTATRIRSRLP